MMEHCLNKECDISDMDPVAKTMTGATKPRPIAGKPQQTHTKSFFGSTLSSAFGTPKGSEIRDSDAQFKDANNPAGAIDVFIKSLKFCNTLSLGYF